MFYLQYANNSPNDLQWLLYCPCITFLQDKIWRLSEICRVQPDKIWLTSKTCFPPNWGLGLDIYQGPVSPMKLQPSFGGLLLNSWWPQTLSLRHQIAVPRFWSINEGPKSGSWGFSQALGGSSLLSRLALAALILSPALLTHSLALLTHSLALHCSLYCAHLFTCLLTRSRARGTVEYLRPIFKVFRIIS